MRGEFALETGDEMKRGSTNNCFAGANYEMQWDEKKRKK
jgi:hypothetical protein